MRRAAGRIGLRGYPQMLQMQLDWHVAESQLNSKTPQAQRF